MKGSVKATPIPLWFVGILIIVGVIIAAQPY